VKNNAAITFDTKSHEESTETGTTLIVTLPVAPEIIIQK
jgi:hypothetical protein